MTKASYAAHPDQSKGRRYSEPKPKFRNDFQRDRDRVIHSASFRRLEYKTQVFVNHEGDLYRTRLTHSLEVAQIARSVARTMALDEDLTEAIALAHDLGHTPFGHAGQDELNRCNREYGGFEHNLQSLRLVDELESSYADFAGLNLTFEAREGLLKHCSQANAKLLGDVGERFLNHTQPSLEAQLTNIADEIAYNNHDIDDGLRSGLITLEQINEVALFNASYKQVMAKYPQLSGRKVVHETIRRIIGDMVVDLVENSQQRINTIGVTTIDDVRHHDKPLMGFSDEMREQNLQLKQFLRKNLYAHHKVYRMTRKAKRVIKALYETYSDDIKLIPSDYQHLAQQALKQDDEMAKARVIVDYIAGMTDRYALEEYKRLFDLTA